MVYQYKYKVSGLNKAPAQVTGEVCSSLEKSVGLTPKTLLDASRDENAPLHNEFEWNDGVAAEKYREYQAAAIIRNLVVVREDTGKEETRAFVNIEHAPGRTGTYRAIQQVIKDDYMYAQLMKQAERDMWSFKQKYSKLERLSAVIAEMEKIIA